MSKHFIRTLPVLKEPQQFTIDNLWLGFIFLCA